MDQRVLGTPAVFYRRFKDNALTPQKSIRSILMSLAWLVWKVINRPSKPQLCFSFFLTHLFCHEVLKILVAMVVVSDFPVVVVVPQEVGETLSCFRLLLHVLMLHKLDLNNHEQGNVWDKVV
jgi:hypothetical protein